MRIIKSIKSIFKKKPKPVVGELKSNKDASKNAAKVSEVKKFLSTKKGTLIKSNLLKEHSDLARAPRKLSRIQKNQRNSLSRKQIDIFIDSDYSGVSRGDHPSQLRDKLLSRGITLDDLRNKGYYVKEVYWAYPVEELCNAFGKNSLLLVYRGDLGKLALDKGVAATAKIYGAKETLDAVINSPKFRGKESFIQEDRASVVEGSFDHDVQTRLHWVVNWVGEQETIKYFGGLQKLVEAWGISKVIGVFGSNIISDLGGIKAISQKHSFWAVTAYLSKSDRKQLMRQYGYELINTYGLPAINRQLDLSDKEVAQIMSKKKN